MLLCLAALLCGTALADAIAEPNDDFYASNRENCVYENRWYYSNGPTGYLDVYERPGGALLGSAENGDDFYVQFTFFDGSVQWGLVGYEVDGGMLEADDDWDALTGWVKMSDMTLKYDSTEFLKDHSAETVDAQTVNLDISGIFGKEIVFWTYPHSGEDIDDDVVLSAEDGFEFTYYYKDEEGLDWGYCGYFRGYRDFWVCLSDPTNENLSVTPHQVQFFTPGPDSEVSPPAPQTQTNLTLIIILCVAVLVLITVVLILVVRNKNKKDSQE